MKKKKKKDLLTSSKYTLTVSCSNMTRANGYLCSLVLKPDLNHPNTQPCFSRKFFSNLLMRKISN